MCRTLVDRDQELAFLHERFSTGERQLLVLYDRRRVRKTALVTEALRETARTRDDLLLYDLPKLAALFDVASGD